MTDKEIVLSLINKINRPGFKKESLIEFLETSDFFYAPASNKYHNSKEGGLCAHCLNVVHNLKLLVDKKNLFNKISEESIIITGLFHDLSKVNLYTKDTKNKKVYSEFGTRSDSLGRYDWVSEEIYTTRPYEERFIFGNHEQTAELMTRWFIPLTIEESVAILHHMGGQGWDSAKDNISEVWKKYPLACLLHLADMISTFIDEK